MCAHSGSSALLVSFGQHAGEESRGEAISAFRKLRENGTHGGKRSLGLGCKEDPRHAYDWNSSLARDASTLPVVDEKKPSRLLLGEGDRFCLSWVQ